MNEFPNQALKEIHCALEKIFKLFVNQRLSSSYQLFSWTSIGQNDRQNDRFAKPNDSLSSFLSKSLLTRHCKKVRCSLYKISLHCQIAH